MADGKPPEIVTVGRIVHYVMPRFRHPHRAAMVIATATNGIEDTCALSVFQLPEDGIEIVRVAYVPFDPTGKIPHSWHWPERDNGLKPPTATPAVTPAEPS